MSITKYYACIIATCGGVVTLGQGEEKFIQSPNYPSNYPTGLECTWLIKVKREVKCHYKF